MMTFRTVFPNERAACSITHEKRLMLMGSCFAEHIGNRLVERKFACNVNPFGIVYNPASIANALLRLCAGEPLYKETDLFDNQGLWHSWDHHGDFSKPNISETLVGINGAFLQAANDLKQADILFLTLGTAELFYLLESNRVVANNHKMPAALFGQKRLNVAEISTQLDRAFKKIQEINQNLEIILTVSPVRHLRNGIVENQRSKATLLLACAELCANLPNTHYFPAYELLLDDLRDYRFYADDMVHPNETAVEYIWQYFSAHYFPEATRALNRDIEKILAAARHRPFNPATPEHSAFAQQQQAAIERLKQHHPDLNFEAEIRYFDSF
ncbi:MAG: GSCFA domain-containing protein [Bacteroidota bacterium]